MKLCQERVFSGASAFSLFNCGEISRQCGWRTGCGRQNYWRNPPTEPKML